MSNRSERREAERAARKLAYQQLRQQQQDPQPQTPVEATDPTVAAAAPEVPLTGRAASARNAVRHGCCADDTIILKTENIQDYQALETTWFQAYKPKNEAEKHMVQELVNADWFLQRANRIVSQVEARIMDETPNPMDWTEEQHKTLTRFLRYQVTRSNNCNRARKALEDFLSKRAAEAIKQERPEVFEEKSKPEPSIRELLDDMLAKKAERDRLKQQNQQ